MGFYKRYLLPKIIHWTCGQNTTMRQREKVIPLAKGRVLEIGIGSGLNLTYYNPAEVLHLTGIDPSKEAWKLAEINVRDLGFDVEFIQAYAGNIPLEDDQFDTAVITYTLCSITDPVVSLKEIRRVLKPSGQLIFCEHGIAPDKKIQRWQNKVNPYWRWISGGCNLNRDIPGLLHEAGFEIVDVDTMYLPGWKLSGYNYWGVGKATK
jgi:ubiquinone/menaquinone biosynthesis C-methylase UbiE